MKKLSMIAALIVGIAMLGAWATAQAGDGFSAPIPVLSDKPNQVGGPPLNPPATKQDATHLKFFKHPQPVPEDARKNFNNDVDQGMVTLEGQAFRISDLSASPGLDPEDPQALLPYGPGDDDANRMVDGYVRVLESMTSSGFCPEAMYFLKELSPQQYQEIYLALECQLTGKDDPKFESSACDPVNAGTMMSNITEVKCPALGNVTDRQLVVADIRNAVPVNENQLLGVDPLVAALIGDAQESLTPYSNDGGATNLYPALVRRADKISESGAVEEKYEFRYPQFQLAGKGYSDLIAYDVADIGEGLLTALYDPALVQFNFSITAAYNQVVPTLNDIYLNLGIGGILPFGKLVDMICNATGSLCSDASLPYFSPVAFFRKDGQYGRMRLSGYSFAPQLSLDVATLPGNFLINYLILNGAHFNPVSVVSMQYPQARTWQLSKTLPPEIPAEAKVKIAEEAEKQADEAGAQEMNANSTTGKKRPPRPFWKPSRGFSVLSQAKIGSLDEIFAFFGIAPLEGPGPLTSTWADHLLVQVNGQFQKLDQIAMPHRVPSFVTFWGVQLNWADPTQEMSWNKNTYDHMNPNSVFNPYVQALIGAGAFYSAESVDFRNNPLTMRHTLIVPSGEPVSVSEVTKPGDPGGNPQETYYVYKIDPINGDHLYFKPFLYEMVNDVPVPSNRALVLPVIVPEHYAVAVPAGFAPYEVRVIPKTPCDDIVLTFRGKDTLPLDDLFLNDPGQNVYFRSSNSQLFANEVRIYPGVLAGDKCTIDGANFTSIPALNANAQIPTVAVENFDGNGGLDLLMGDQIVRQVMEQGAPDLGRYTAHAYLYPDFSAATAKAIRVGFESTSENPAAAASTTDYLLKAMKDDTGKSGFPGVAELAANPQPQKSSANIGSINGAPLMLPPFGCPHSENATVASVLELVGTQVATGLPSAEPMSCWEKKANICTLTLDSGGSVPLPFLENGVFAQCCTCEGMADQPLCGIIIAFMAQYISMEDANGYLQKIALQCNPEAAEANKCAAWVTQLPQADQANATTACCRVGHCEESCNQYLTSKSVSCDEDSTTSKYEWICSKKKDDNCPFPAPGARNDTETDGEADTDFASAWRPDAVVGPDRHGIVGMPALAPAGNDFEAGGIIINPGSSFYYHHIGDFQLDVIICGDGKKQGDEQCDKGSIGIAGVPCKDDAGNLDEAMKCNQQCQCVPKPVCGNDTREGSEQCDGNDTGFCLPGTDCSGKKDGTPNCTCAISEYPRLPRGQVMPGKREMTVVVATNLPDQPFACPPNAPIGQNGVECTGQGVGICNWDAGEICTSECTCHRSCSDTGGPLMPGWECNKDTHCAGGYSCAIDHAGNCTCQGAPPPAQEELVDDCNCVVTSDYSNEAKARRQAWNKEFISEPSGRPLYDERLVAHEQKFSCTCCAKDALDANMSVRPFKALQYSGALLEDFRAPGKFSWANVLPSRPLQLLSSAELGPLGGGSAQQISADFSSVASNAVMWASYDVTPTIQQVASNVIDINNNVQVQIQAFASPASYSISSSGGADIGFAAPAGSACWVYSYTAVPACPTFTQAGGGDSTCAERGVIMPDDFPKVKALIAENAKTLKASAVFMNLKPFEQSNSYLQVSHFQMVQEPGGALAMGVGVNPGVGSGSASGGGAAFKKLDQAMITYSDSGPTSQGCSNCTMVGTMPALGDILPALFAALAAGGGLIAARRRMGRK